MDCLVACVRLDSDAWRTDSKNVAHNKRMNRSRKAAAAESLDFHSVLIICRRVAVTQNVILAGQIIWLMNLKIWQLFAIVTWVATAMAFNVDLRTSTNYALSAYLVVQTAIVLTFGRPIVSPSS